MITATRRKLITRSALSGPINAAAYVVAAGGTRPGIAMAAAIGKSVHATRNLMNSAVAAAAEMPARPASPAGVPPAFSSPDLAGATPLAVAPAFLGAGGAMPAGQR